MKFSVLMSVYKNDHDEFFDAALNSILIDQSIVPNEVILVVDGPVGIELNYIIEKYETMFPDTVKTLRLEKNGGLGEALRYGLEECSNELVARMDSDDISHPNRFETQLKMFHNDASLDVCGTSVYEFDNDYHTPKCRKDLPADFIKIQQMLKCRNPMAHVTVMFKKSAIKQIGSYIEIKYLEDYFLWIRAVERGLNMMNIQECLLYVRVGNGFVNRRSSPEYLEGWKRINQYMLHCHLINRVEFFRNLMTIRLFIYMPVSLKKLIYKVFLRKPSNLL